jgi:hypothetical protein
MAGYSSSGGGGFDYVQPGEPNNPQLGDLWFDTDAGSDGSGEAKVYDSTGWVVTGYASHTDLMDIGADDHHSPVTVSDPLTENGTQGLGLSIGDGVTLSGGALVAALSTGLTIDGGGNVRVAPNGITNALIAADAVDTGQLAAGAVGSSQIQTGAVRHGTEADTPSDAHHTRYSDSEAASAAPVQSVDGQTGDVSVDTTSVNGRSGSLQFRRESGIVEAPEFGGDVLVSFTREYDADAVIPNAGLDSGSTSQGTKDAVPDRFRTTGNGTVDGMYINVVDNDGDGPFDVRWWVMGLVV